MIAKTYLDDAVYADFDGFGFTLTGPRDALAWQAAVVATSPVPVVASGLPMATSRSRPLAPVVTHVGPPNPSSRRAGRLLAAPVLAAVGRAGGVCGGGSHHQALAVDMGPATAPTLEVGEQ